MLIPAIRKSVPCNLRRIAAYVIYRNKMRTKIAWQCYESDLFVSFPNVATCRNYSTESNSGPRVSLPMLVDNAKVFMPSFLMPFRLFFLSNMTISRIDKEFTMSETSEGIKYVRDFSWLIRNTLLRTVAY